MSIRRSDLSADSKEAPEEPELEIQSLSILNATRRKVQTSFSTPWTYLQSLHISEDLIGIGLALFVGLTTGIAAILFRWLIAFFQTLFFDGGGEFLSFMGSYYVIIVPAAGGLVVGLLVYFLAREARGHGVPEVMAAMATTGGRIRPRVAVIKSLASSICIGSGGSVGREGPIVQIGSALGSSIGQRLKLQEDWVKTLLACGAAGGISATFNAPIAGTFFALEIILRRYVVRSFGLVLLSSITAAIAARALIGDQITFSIPNYELVSGWELPLYLLLGVLSAIAAHVFVTVLYGFEDYFEKLPIPQYILPVIGGLGVGAIGLFYPQVFGVGYEDVEPALRGEMAFGLMAALLGLKLLATSLTLGSGGSGGVFAPSLFLGAMLGGAFGQGVHAMFPDITAPAGAYALVGMGAVFAGGARAPITGIVILFEMTHNYEIIVPLMMTVIVSTILARALRRDSIYTIKLRRRGLRLPDEEEQDVLGSVKVGEAMYREPPTVTMETSLPDLRRLFATTGRNGFPVVDESRNLLGIVTLSDMERAQDIEHQKVGDIATRQIVAAYPDQTVHDALAQLGGIDVGRIPVISRNGDNRKLLGVLRREDIVKAYARAVNGKPEASPAMEHQ